MKSTHSLLLAVSLLLCCVTQSIAQAKKYDIKSGIITYETAITIGDMKATHRSIVYFDDYGAKECKETYGGNKLTHVVFSDGKTAYGLSPAQKRATRGEVAFNGGTELRYDWQEASSKEEAERHAAKIPNMAVAGKNCEAFKTTQKETICTFGGWNHILLYFETTGGNSKSVTKAVKVEENVPVPPEKFKVPAGYTVQ